MARGSEEVGFAEAAMEILNEIIAPSAPSPRRATSHTRTRAATRGGGVQGWQRRQMKILKQILVKKSYNFPQH